MRILITGGTGFIGTALCQKLIQRGHQLTMLSRQYRADQQAVRFIQNFANLTSLDGFDVVINLAGEPIFERAWSEKQKQKLRQSRLDITQKLVELCQNSQNPPSVFISGSATGYYGNLPDFAKNCDETTACSPCFTGQLCQEWENIALQAQSERTRVCLLRTGIVLAKHGGALKQMLPLYRLGLGGKLGSGKQHWAWISLDDHLNAIDFLLNHTDANGAFNLTSPMPATNAEFNRLLATHLHRPAFFAVPKWVLKCTLGERSQLLLDNQPLVPRRLLEMGFIFQDAHLKTYNGFKNM